MGAHGTCAGGQDAQTGPHPRRNLMLLRIAV
jgi:hypothetical protein